jgi:hypothetical protein
MNCNELRTRVLGWFGSEIECQPSGEDSLIATFPLLRLNGDAIEIGIESAENGRWRLSDLGETHSSFYLAGLDFYEHYVRADEFKQVISAHHIRDAEQELSVEVARDDLAGGIFDFLHALQTMSGLQFTAKPREEERDFALVVAKFFGEQRASFEVPERYIEGISGNRWKFQFVLNHTRAETLVRTISTKSKTGVLGLAEKATFEIGDVKNLRSVDAVVIGDDLGSERKSVWLPNVVAIFDKYQIPFYSFERNNDMLVELAQKYALPKET